MQSRVADLLHGKAMVRGETQRAGAPVHEVMEAAVQSKAWEAKDRQVRGRHARQGKRGRKRVKAPVANTTGTATPVKRLEGRQAMKTGTLRVWMLGAETEIVQRRLRDNAGIRKARDGHQSWRRLARTSQTIAAKFVKLVRENSSSYAEKTGSSPTSGRRTQTHRRRRKAARPMAHGEDAAQDEAPQHREGSVLTAIDAKSHKIEETGAIDEHSTVENVRDSGTATARAEGQQQPRRKEDAAPTRREDDVGRGQSDPAHRRSTGGSAHAPEGTSEQHAARDEDLDAEKPTEARATPAAAMREQREQELNAARGDAVRRSEEQATQREKRARERAQSAAEAKAVREAQEAEEATKRRQQHEAEAAAAAETKEAREAEAAKTAAEAKAAAAAQSAAATETKQAADVKAREAQKTTQAKAEAEATRAAKARTAAGARAQEANATAADGKAADEKEAKAEARAAAAAEHQRRQKATETEAAAKAKQAAQRGSEASTGPSCQADRGNSSSCGSAREGQKTEKDFLEIARATTSHELSREEAEKLSRSTDAQRTEFFERQCGKLTQQRGWSKGDQAAFKAWHRQQRDAEHEADRQAELLCEQEARENAQKRPKGKSKAKAAAMQTCTATKGPAWQLASSAGSTRSHAHGNRDNVLTSVFIGDDDDAYESADEGDAPETLVVNVFHGNDDVGSCREQQERKTTTKGTCRQAGHRGHVTEARPAEDGGGGVADEALFKEFVQEVLEAGNILMTDGAGLGAALRRRGWPSGRIEKFQEWRTRRQREMNAEIEARRRHRQAEREAEDEEFRQTVHRLSMADLELFIQTENEWRGANEKTQRRLVVEAEIQRRSPPKTWSTEDLRTFSSQSEEVRDELRARGETVDAGQEREGEPLQLLGISFADDADEAAGARRAAGHR